MMAGVAPRHRGEGVGAGHVQQLFPHRGLVVQLGEIAMRYTRFVVIQ